MRSLPIIFLSSLFIIGCAESQSEKARVPKSEQSGILTSSEMFGSEWPFTVSSGVVDCVKGSAAVFKANGKSYQLNGVASMLGFESIDSIWKDNPAIPGTKVNIDPMIDLVLKQC